jgi:hypothetical protein
MEAKAHSTDRRRMSTVAGLNAASEGGPHRLRQPRLTLLNHFVISIFHRFWTAIILLPASLCRNGSFTSSETTSRQCPLA